MIQHAFTFQDSVRLLVALLLFSVTLTGCTGDETPEDTQEDVAPADEAMTAPIASGRATYEAYCASCHGENGKGDGPVGADLALQPADLTRLSINHGGTFPVDSVYQTIDGRKEVEAHGTRDMPVWGNVWSEEDGEPVRPEVVERRINELVEYLRSIQVESNEMR